MEIIAIYGFLVVGFSPYISPETNVTIVLYCTIFSTIFTVRITAAFCENLKGAVRFVVCYSLPALTVKALERSKMLHKDQASQSY